MLHILCSALHHTSCAFCACYTHHLAWCDAQAKTQHTQGGLWPRRLPVARSKTRQSQPTSINGLPVCPAGALASICCLLLCALHDWAMLQCYSDVKHSRTWGISQAGKGLESCHLAAEVNQELSSPARASSTCNVCSPPRSSPPESSPPESSLH